MEFHGVGGIVVSIAAFQAVDPGSIPGQRSDYFQGTQQSYWADGISLTTEKSSTSRTAPLISGHILSLTYSDVSIS